MTSMSIFLVTPTVHWGFTDCVLLFLLFWGSVVFSRGSNNVLFLAHCTRTVMAYMSCFRIVHMAVSKKSVPGAWRHFDIPSLVTPSLQTSKSRTQTFGHTKVSELRGKSRLHPPRHYVFPAMLFLEIRTISAVRGRTFLLLSYASDDVVHFFLLDTNSWAMLSLFGHFVRDSFFY